MASIGLVRKTPGLVRFDHSTSARPTYPSSESLAQHRSERQELWRRHSAKLCQDPRLVFYFRFDELDREHKVVDTVYDSLNRSAVYYANGKSVGSTTLAQSVPLRIGMAEIGNWLRPRETGEEPVRNLVGRIDEFALFGAALDESSIQEMYEAGRP